MNWDDLRVFWGVVKARSIAEAARDLRINRSTLSRRMTLLEEALGTRLFLRTREGLRLAPAGEQLERHVARIAAEIRAITDTSLVRDDSVAGVVRLATTEGLASYLVELGLAGLRTRHPELVLEIHTGNRAADLAHGEADLALRVLPPAESTLRARRVLDMAFALYAAPSYLDRRGQPRGPEALAGHDVIVPCGELDKLPETVWLTQQPGVHVAFRSNNFPALIAAAVAGVGIVVLAVPWAEREPGLRHIADLPMIPPRRLWLVQNPDSAHRAAVRVVADAIAELIAA